ncbi:MAG: ABC transporter ATP-binding protein/permease [Treponema sp.]|nr:ABC transporter ATP-binding protein/permease [Treponema sp.]
MGVDRPPPRQNQGPRFFGGRGGPGMMMGQPVEKPKNLRGTLKRIIRYLGTQKYALTGLIIMVISSSALSLVMPVLQKDAINTISLSEGLRVDFDSLTRILVQMGILFVITAVITLFQGLLAAAVSQKTVRVLRSDMMNKLQYLEVKFFDRRTHGEIMSRLTNDVDNISTSVSQSISSLFSGAVVIIGSLSMMLYYSRLLTIVSLIIVPMGIVITKKISSRTRVYFRNQQDRLGELNGHIEEMITGQKTVIAFNRQRHSIEQFDGINAHLRRESTLAQIFSTAIGPLMNVLNNLSFACLAITGGILIMNQDAIAASLWLRLLCGSISIGTIQLFINLSRQFARPLNELANQFNLIQSAIAGAERVFDLMDQEIERDTGTFAMLKQNVRGNVEFKEVDFGYEPNKPVLKSFSIDVKSGQKIALVGPTGAGKTTVVNLLTRFYDIEKGAVSLDGINIKDIKMDDLRRSIGIVLQDTVLFTGTISDNIRYGKLDASDAELKRAAITAYADGFINHLKNGYETELSESGSNLSQGQRQLISIARAVLADPRILILDEATSNVDTRTEMHIQQAMQDLMKGRTCFIIAHRLSTIRNADTILVIEGGHIAESGSHEELMEKQGAYYTLYQNQLSRTAD